MHKGTFIGEVCPGCDLYVVQSGPDEFHVIGSQWPNPLTKGDEVQWEYSHEHKKRMRNATRGEWFFSCQEFKSLTHDELERLRSKENREQLHTCLVSNQGTLSKGLLGP